MFKNIIITILTILVILFWLKEEPEDMVSDDPNDVTIEYKCNELDTYENEVTEECKSRGYAVRNTI